MAYFDATSGKLVAGKVVGGGVAASRTELETAVSEAVARCGHRKYGSAKKELERLFRTYPQLKRDSWPLGEHPVSPLIELFVQELFR